jgi:ABC-2 type transport system permease protein
MSIRRIYAIVLRFFYLFRRSYDRMSDAFYWPTIDLLLWGLTSLYFRSYLPNASKVIMLIVSGILLWIIVWRSQYEITVNLLEDLWNKNLINIFAAPLKFWEWISAFIIYGIIKAIISLAFASGVAYLLYKVNLFTFGFYLIPFIFLLIMSGWWVGFFIAGMILRFGTKVQTFAWTFVALFSPFSAIYYPVSILPGWAQVVAKFTPMSYVFEGAREVINKGVLDANKLIICFVLNLVYLCLSLIFIRKSFDKVLEKGLVKVY